MVDRSQTEPATSDIAPILHSLEEQLFNLDQLGASLAAAHLDAAIQQLRVDSARRLAMASY